MRISKAIGIVCLAALAAAAADYPSAREGGRYMHNYYIPPAPSTTPWAPAWSPDGKWIAVAMYGSIWRVDPETGVAVELTYNRKYHSSPAVSPDGKWLVYTADDDGRTLQLEALELATGRTHALTSDDFIYLDPAFSPDGTRLAYVSTRPNGHFNIFVRPIRDGRWAGEEIALTRDNAYERDRLYFGRWDMHTQPAWTPDNREIVFVSNRGVPLGSGDLWRMPAEAGGIDRAVRVLEEQTLYRTRPDVSRDGKRILYSSTGGAADQFNHLYVIPLAGGFPYKLTFGEHDDFHPRFSPDGEWIAFISNEGGLPELVLLETYGGARKRIAVGRRQWRRPMGRLEVRVLDEATGKPTAARIHGLASDGKFYAPAEAYSRLGNARVHSFHTQGEFAVEVPPGKMRIEAVKGFQYLPASAEVEIRAGETAELVLRLARPERLVWRGWRSGSTHVHMNYGGNLRNTPGNLIEMARAEGLDVVMNQAANKDNRVLDYQYFAGAGEHPASTSDVLLHMGQEYRPPFWGHVFLLGLEKHYISPYTTGYERTGIESLYPSNTDIFRKAKAQGAVTGYVHAFSGDADPLEGALGGAKAFPVDAALGAVDCLEWSSANRATHLVWRHALNNDLRIVPVGGEDSISDLHWSKLIGSVRTYVYLGGAPFTLRAWLEALRSGHTFMSTGPLIDFKIDGKIPGEEIRLPAGGGAVTLEVRVESLAPLARVVIYRNGEVFREIPPGAPFRARVEVSASSWFSVYAEGPPYRLLDAEYPQAVTNAIRVYVGEMKIRNRASAEYFIRWIDRLRQMADAWPWWRSEREKERVFAQIAEARRVYERLAAEASR